MTSKHEGGFATNVFQHLDARCSFYVLGFCLASHDIAYHRELINRLINNGEGEEANYHFAVSLSILREVAKLVDRVDKVALTTRFSQDTTDLFRDLKKDLQSFQKNSLTKGTLEPIRNITFHYDLDKADQKITGSLLAQIKKQHELRVRANSADNSILRYRYTFADEFRSKLVENYLTKDIMNQITLAAVNVIAFTDSLMADLS